jgi:hypothetical protein
LDSQRQFIEKRVEQTNSQAELINRSGVNAEYKQQPAKKERDPCGSSPPSHLSKQPMYHRTTVSACTLFLSIPSPTSLLSSAVTSPQSAASSALLPTTHRPWIRHHDTNSSSTDVVIQPKQRCRSIPHSWARLHSTLRLRPLADGYDVSP